MECFRRLITYPFDLGGKIIKWATSSRRTFNASDTWCFLIGSAPDEASLRLLRLFFLYIMGDPSLISTISFLADIRERDRRPELVFPSHLRQLLYCRLRVRSVKKDDLPVSSSLSLVFILLLVRTSE